MASRPASRPPYIKSGYQNQIRLEDLTWGSYPPICVSDLLHAANGAVYSGPLVVVSLLACRILQSQNNQVADKICIANSCPYNIHQEFLHNDGFVLPGLTQDVPEQQ